MDFRLKHRILHDLLYKDCDHTAEAMLIVRALGLV